MKRALFCTCTLISTGLFAASPARGDTTLRVDLADPMGPATHVASGSLYGLIEARPADLDTLVAPLRPKMFANPAANVQQPHGDAILVAQRVAPYGATVTIRLADWFPGWPYNFTSMNDWLDKVGQTVARKQASGVDNYYGYEIWNEPVGTWTSSIPFNDFWKQTFDELRRLDPTAKIIGPSYAWYDAGSLRSFLTFARDNACLPDIVAWHEWGGNPGGNVQAYRTMEQQLGIGPLRISINEYSGAERIDDEGQPGASAPMIAKFERFGVDTACISYWDVAHPGRLGSLLATDTQPNGGWWFYKWYGDMSGTMVATFPAAANEVTTLDGFANLDPAAQRASVLFAGVNDGTIRLVIEGFSAAPFFGGTVHAVVERTPWVNRTTVVTSTEVLSTADIPITGEQIEIAVPAASDVDGYRVTLTPTQPGTGGTGGVGGTSGGGPTGGAATGGTGGEATGGAGGGGAGGTDCAGAAEQAYLAAPSGVPGTVEAEGYDPSGYYDLSAGNEGGAFRTDEDVDVKELGGGYAVGWMTAGEWLEYTVNVAVEGDYAVTLAAGAVEAGRTVVLSLCDVPLATVDIAQIGAWGEVASTAPTVVHLPAGLQVIRVTVGVQDYLDLDSLTFERVAAGTGGAPGTGGSSGGGTTGTGGGAGTAGVAGSGGGLALGGSGGAPSSGGALGSGGSGGTRPLAPTADEASCSCRTAGRRSRSPSWLAVALAALVGLRRRKRT